MLFRRRVVAALAASLLAGGASADILVLVCDEGKVAPQSLTQCQYETFQDAAWIEPALPTLQGAVADVAQLQADVAALQAAGSGGSSSLLPDLTMSEAGQILGAACGLWGLVFAFRVFRKILEES